MKIEQAFNQSAATYDVWVRKALPGFDDLFYTAQQVLPFPPNSAIHALDLGAGTGLFSARILEWYPNAHVTLIDLAEQMLAVARKRFAAYAGQVDYRIEDFSNLQEVQTCDLVVSSLAIHHLEHPAKQELFARIHQALKPGGIFLNLDQIQAPTPALRAHYKAVWLEGVKARGGSEEEIAISIQRRTTYDRDASLTDQIDWLRQAGFDEVDVLYKHHFIGLFYARRAA